MVEQVDDAEREVTEDDLAHRVHVRGPVPFGLLTRARGDELHEAFLRPDPAAPEGKRPYVGIDQDLR